MSINELQDEVIEEFEAFEDWMSRYQLIVDYANELKKHPMPASDKTQQNLIEGCQSQVWFTAKMEEGRMVLNADSEAVLVRGIVALLLHVLNNHTPQEIAQADLYFVDAIGGPLAKLNELEAQIPAVLEKIAADKAAILESITGQ